MKLESPPAWTQEAYRPRCSEYSFCCPNWVPPTWPGGYPTWVPPLARVPPPARVPPRPGYPPSRLDLAGYPPPPTPPPPRLPHGILGNVAKHYGIWVPPQVWTDWKHYLPHPSDAGGKNEHLSAVRQHLRVYFSSFGNVKPVYPRGKYWCLLMSLVYLQWFLRFCSNSRTGFLPQWQTKTQRI